MEQQWPNKSPTFTQLNSNPNPNYWKRNTWLLYGIPGTILKPTWETPKLGGWCKDAIGRLFQMVLSCPSAVGVLVFSKFLSLRDTTATLQASNLYDSYP